MKLKVGQACMSRAACTDSHVLTNVCLNTTNQSGSTSPLVRFYELLAAAWRRRCHR